MNKTIPKKAKLYCPTCMCEQPVREGTIEGNLLPIFCTVCRKQVSELVHTENGWQLHACFYKKGVPP